MSQPTHVFPNVGTANITKISNVNGLSQFGRISRRRFVSERLGVWLETQINLLVSSPTRRLLVYIYATWSEWKNFRFIAFSVLLAELCKGCAGYIETFLCTLLGSKALQSPSNIHHRSTFKCIRFWEQPVLYWTAKHGATHEYTTESRIFILYRF